MMNKTKGEDDDDRLKSDEEDDPPINATKMRKHPGAPKRFRSAFILFSQKRHKELRATLDEKGEGKNTMNVAKRVSEEWKALGDGEKKKWEMMAERDKARYLAEKESYDGPWHVPANRRRPKDPTSPKKPVPAYFAFSNERRQKVKMENPNATNGEISRILSKMWKEASDDVRQMYIDEEDRQRAAYTEAMGNWRNEKKKEKSEKLERLIAGEDEIPVTSPVDSSSSIAHGTQHQILSQSADAGHEDMASVAASSAAATLPQRQSQPAPFASSQLAEQLLGGGHIPSLGGIDLRHLLSQPSSQARLQQAQLQNQFFVGRAPSMSASGALLQQQLGDSDLVSRLIEGVASSTTQQQINLSAHQRLQEGPSNEFASLVYRAMNSLQQVPTPVSQDFNLQMLSQHNQQNLLQSLLLQGSGTGISSLQPQASSSLLLPQNNPSGGLQQQQQQEQQSAASATLQHLLSRHASRGPHHPEGGPRY